MNELKAADLRIGNLVSVPREDQSPFRVDLIEYASATYCKVGMNVHKFDTPFGVIDGHPLTWELPDLRSIPLTSEWLEKLGFTTLSGTYSKSTELDMHIMLIQSTDGFYPQLLQDAEMSCDETQCVSLPRAETVHALQNLFYIISGGQELTIGETSK